MVCYPPPPTVKHVWGVLPSEGMMHTCQKIGLSHIIVTSIPRALENCKETQTTAGLGLVCTVRYLSHLSGIGI